MKLCSFCRQKNDRKTKKYCKKCNRLYLEQQAHLPKEIRMMNSDLVHRRKFKMCACNNALRLPRLKFCKNCHKKDLIIFRIKCKVREFTKFCIKYGIIKKPKFCELCKNKKIEAHHEDYFQPLKIKWLCKEHHIETHVNIRKENRKLFSDI